MYGFSVNNLILNLDLTNLFLNVFSILIMPFILLFLNDDKNKKKEIFIKRCSVYIECFEILEKYKENTTLAFNNEFIIKIEKIKLNMVMFASFTVLNEFDKIYKSINQINDDYNKKFNTLEGITYFNEIINVDKNFESIDEYEEQYMLEKCEKSENVKKYLIDLVEEMKKELKTDK